MFSRLLAVDDSMGPLPRTAVDFYIAVLNRMHARAGPLVSEAVEGYSHVKCRVSTGSRHAGRWFYWLRRRLTTEAL